MTSEIELAALLARDGRLLLIRAAENAEWRLPGGQFAAGEHDVDAAMERILQLHGIEAPAVEEDFLQTVYLPGAAGQRVLNLYGPTEWSGQPVAPEGGECGWFTLDELGALATDASVREAVASVFGDGPELIDEFDALMQDELEELQHAFTQTTAEPPRPAASRPAPAARREAGLDVLRTLSGADPEVAAARLARSRPEIAGDIVDFALGEVWSGAALDRKTRSLEVVAMLAALGGRPGTLRSHLHGALNHGATAAEVVETLRMVAVYAGFPAALEAWTTMEEVFAARGIERPGAAR